MVKVHGAQETFAEDLKVMMVVEVWKVNAGLEWSEPVVETDFGFICTIFYVPVPFLNFISFHGFARNFVVKIIAYLIVNPTGKQLKINCPRLR